jgi:hypothetical protein
MRSLLSQFREKPEIWADNGFGNIEGDCFMTILWIKMKIIESTN